MNLLPGPLLFLLLALVASAQNQPKFEVASVKRADRCGGGSSLDPGSVSLRGLPLKPILMEAFQVKLDQIEGPSWLETDCFDISAKFPPGAAKEQLPAMLQALMADRFKLAVHKEERTRSGYSLVVDKGGPKCKQDDPSAGFMGAGARPGLTLYGASGHGRLKGVMTMATLASNLSKEGYGPVEDATSLTGKYDIDLTWTSDTAVVPHAGDATASAATAPGADLPAPEPNLFAAIRQSLGLRLAPRTVRLQYVIVDHIERTPTGN